MSDAPGLPQGSAMNLASFLDTAMPAPGDGNLFELTKAQVKTQTRAKRARKSNRDPDFDPDAMRRPSKDLCDAFQWNSVWKQRLESHGLDLNTEPFQGHFEFSGGGGAEVAARALSAAGIGTIHVAAQSDWDCAKKRALLLNDPEVCKFGDIMDVVRAVDREKFFTPVQQNVTLSQYELHGVLNLRRCRVRSSDSGAKASDASGSTTSDSSDTESSSFARKSSMDVSPISASKVSNPGNESMDDGFPASEETSIYNPNDESFVDLEWVRTKVLGLFPKGCLKTSIGDAQSGWQLDRAVCKVCNCRSNETDELCEDQFQDAIHRLVELVCADHNCSMEFSFNRRQGTQDRVSPLITLIGLS